MHCGESLISVVQEFFASIDKIFILAGGLSARLSFYEVLRFSCYLLISWESNSWAVWQCVKHLLYTMFTSINRASFPLWWKWDLVNQKVSKYYENDCRFYSLCVLVLRCFCIFGFQFLVFLYYVLNSISSQKT